MDSMRYLLVFGAILTLLCGIVPVSADEILIDEVFIDHISSENIFKNSPSPSGSLVDTISSLVIYNVEYIYGVNIEGITLQSQGDMVTNYATLPPSDWSIMTFDTDGISGSLTFGYFKFQTPGGTDYLQIWVQDVEFNTLPSGMSGGKILNLVPEKPGFKFPQYSSRMRVSYTGSDLCISPFYSGGSLVTKRILANNLLNVLSVEFKNQLIVSYDGVQDTISIIRNFNETSYYSYVSINPLEDSLLIPVYEGSDGDRIYSYHKSFRPYKVGVYSPLLDKWYGNYTIGVEPVTPTPTPVVPTTAYTAKIEARDYHTNEILPDVHFLVVDFKKSETLYNEWVSAGFIEIPLEYRSYDDSHFPKQYGIRASKQGYYADDIIVSHWIKPYTFIIRMRDIYSEEPLDTSLITFHIRDRFSNNYIDTARLIITHYDKGEVFNQTVNGGIQSVRLPQTQPYDPQFDYNATVKADNYDDAVIGFSVYNDVDINIKMFPGEGTPEEGHAFIHFTVGYFDNNNIFRNIPGAKITIGAQSVYTNTAGYAQFELPDNDFYTYTAEHFEFETVSGSIMLQGSRTHNIIMHRREVPTTPTAQPTFPGEELVDESYLDWMARNFAKAFNLSLEGGKLFMGMIISLAIGMITAKKLNGGAAEFGIGMLGGMVLCILIGILPLWPIIALLLIVGLYIGMQIARGDKQGGR